MPEVIAQADNLDELNRRFAQRPLAGPVFVNSVPKCGTHLLRNILRMFVPVEQQYHRAFIQIPILRSHLAAYSTERPFLSWGHLLFSDDSAIALAGVRHVLLVRDPYDWVLARTRFFLSDNFRGSVEHLKQGGASVEEVMNMMILGIHDKVPPLGDIFLHNAVGWLGARATLLRYEDLVRELGRLDSAEAERYFGTLLDHCGLGEPPPDWRERIRTGADRRQSGTARENLAAIAMAVPDRLPAIQRRMVDLVAPGLRALLGYD
jgi:hypothetical protein